MPPRKFDPFEVKPLIQKTYVDDDKGDFLSDGEVTFTLEGSPSITLPFKAAKTQDDAIFQTATDLERMASNYLKIARRLLQN